LLRDVRAIRPQYSSNVGEYCADERYYFDRSFFACRSRGDWGSYLVWLWLREGRPLWVGALGAIVLIIYGIIPTIQRASFGRVYAAYGGVFVLLSVLWGWRLDGIRPDRPDAVGAAICILGAAIIMCWPRA